MAQPVAINPLEVRGAWTQGWTLDAHTSFSEFVGYDESGHAQFETERTVLGELVYQLKYRGQTAGIESIAVTMADFLGRRTQTLPRFALVLPMPPSNRSRVAQPVPDVARRLAVLLDKVYCADAVTKVVDTPQLKDVRDLAERREVLDRVFEVDAARVKEQGVLLIDDLFRSGATANAVTLVLSKAGARRAYFLAATRTRSNT